MIALSIITVCLNEERRIEKTAYSIVTQKCREFEWIVIDGGSTDGTLDILKRYNNNIKIIISEKDQGVYDAMNKGILCSEGEYCLFMNGGDKLYDFNAIKCFLELNKMF